jgi:type III pantothenate kinase
MLLAIDVGNTHTVFGVFKGSALVSEWRVTSSQQRTEDEIGTQLISFFSHFQIPKKEIGGIGISSVVPNLTDVYAAMARKYFGIEPMVVGLDLDLGIRVLYDDPHQVGADRLCNAVAAYAKYGGPLIIIDFGTATTFDIVAANGDYLGGVIAPGVETSAMDLHRRAAKLPRIELRFPPTMIATDTVTSMQAGILFGALDGMEGIVRRLQIEINKREGKQAKIIATGGFSGIMSRHSRLIEALEPSLVLDGIRLMHERMMNANEGKSKKK